ncbi:MAG: hypothetical protein ACRDNG_02295, partial [Gaiellaceae bacterium]
MRKTSREREGGTLGGEGKQSDRRWSCSAPRGSGSPPTPGSCSYGSSPTGSVYPRCSTRSRFKKRKRGYAASQQILSLCETLIAGGECLDDAAVLRADSAQELLRGHAVPDPTTLGRFLATFSLGHIGQLKRCLDRLFARVHPLLERGQVTLDLDSTLIEHHGPVGSRQGTRG